MAKSRSRGFTLIELMIVVAVIAVLAVIALPSYLAQVRHSRRSDSVSQINSIALAEEQWRTNCPSYAAFAAAACVTGNPAFMSAPSSTYYTYALSNVAATSYTITATPQGDQVNDKQFGTACSSMVYAFNAGAISKTPATCWGL
jgi:type IV pilus assembly protein PilE